MTTIFEVPCPSCGQGLLVAEGALECPGCRRAYQSRMGHLFPMAERASSTIAASAARPAPGRS